MTLFTKENLFVIKNDNLILQGLRNENDGLWDVIFPRQWYIYIKDEVKTKTQSINYIIQTDKSKLDLAQYLHA